MLKNSTESYIGGDKWKFSDRIYLKLTGKKVKSKYNPKIFVFIKQLQGILPKKKVIGLFWSTPTFKEIDCHYLFHVYDKSKVDYVISTSSANTVESMARTIKKYNQESHKNIKAILLVPELSSYKVAKSAIDDNPYINYIVLKNSTLDSIREFAVKLEEKISKNYSVVSANADLKTAAYAQMGFVLNNFNLMNENTCFVQTVSGGVGPVGIIESAYQLNVTPEILVIQPVNGKSTPIIDALNEHSCGKDPLSIFEERNYETSSIETTLGSTKPIYAIKKFIKWRENGGRILASQITREDLFQNKDFILDVLVGAGIYPNNEIGMKLFELEKSGFMAFIGVIKSANQINSKNIVINFTGRYLNNHSSIPIPAKPHVLFNPSNGIEELLNILKIK
ncbi:MAG: hypothetical protein ACFFAN_06210 [Promethearchaeota archaeon]